jgi:hypothetical protein
MQKNQFFQKKILFLLSSVLLIVAIFSASSCKNKGKGEKSLAASNFKMNCVILTKAQVQTWINEDSTHPNWIKKILLQFYSADASNANSNMQLKAYPGKNMTDAGYYGDAILSIDTTCVALPLTDSTIFANNWINVDSLKIVDTSGHLTDFDFIRLKPSKFFAPLINFNIEIVRNGIVADKDKFSYASGTNPCPPCQYCPGGCIQ